MISLIVIGLIWITKTVLCFCYSAFYGLRVFIWSRIRKIDLIKRYGEYVVITGATDGIGLAMALEFANRGHSLVIIGRNETKLNNTKQALEKIVHSGRNVITILADLSTTDPSIYHNIEDSLKEIKSKIGILVNNAGVFFEKPDKFLNISEKEVLDMIQVNIAAVLMITRAVLPFMVENRRGIVVNVGSQAALRPMPLFGIYGASKKFVEYFSASLKYEYKESNLEVQIIHPGPVITKLADWMKVAKVSLIAPTPTDYAVSAIATIGLTSRTSGFWSHEILGLVIGAIPSFILNPLQMFHIKKLTK